MRSPERRNTESVKCNKPFNADVDNASRTFSAGKYLTLIYSTHSHTPEKNETEDYSSVKVSKTQADI